MKLVQIYSNDSRFKSVKFNENFNVIVGRIKNSENLNRDSHNLGKSTLAQLIDFMLLKNVDKKFFLFKEIFRNFTFYMEIQLNSGKYVTIRRSVKQNTKISFKLHNNKYHNALNDIDWDYENLSLNSKTKNPKIILNQLLEFDVMNSYDYRKTLSYFLRSQNDYGDLFRLSKFKGKDLDWKPILFELLGFKGEVTRKKYEAEMDVSEQQRKIDNIKSTMDICIEEKDKLVSLIKIREEERDETQKRIDKFDFYKKESRLEKDIVEKIEFNISELNMRKYDLDYEISKIKESIQEGTAIQLEKIKSIFKEANIYFGSQIQKDYNELIEFNEQITEERNKYLEETLSIKENELKEIERKLVKENEKRCDSLKFLGTSDTFKKYKKYQDDIISIERNIERLEQQLEQMDVLKEDEKLLDDLKSQVKKYTDKISNELDREDSIYRKIQHSYKEYMQFIIKKTALVHITINKNKNIEFNDEILDDNDFVTSQNEGHSYKKICCACFDLALIVNYIDKSYYRFIYHDGCLEALDPRKQRRYLELVKKLSNKYDFQYILTALETDIPIIEGMENIVEERDRVLELDDSEDDSGRLFSLAF